MTIDPKLFNITYHDWQTLVFIHNIFSTRLLQFIRPVKEEQKHYSFICNAYSHVFRYAQCTVCTLHAVASYHIAKETA